MEKNLYIGALLEVYGQFLSEKQRELTYHYYNDDLSLSEIAENEGITRQGVRDIIKRAETTLFDMEKNCGYLSKFTELKMLKGEYESGKEAALGEILEIIDTL
ncbi:MAG: hypothetical protein MJ091_03195 [Clostridia bacterium]|nr:hypothetical protein [Clostridia bacterium]